jgi:hypothetical protein
MEEVALDQWVQVDRNASGFGNAGDADEGRLREVAEHVDAKFG